MDNNASKINLGQRVSWKSQAAGSTVEKEGTVIYLGPGGTFHDVVQNDKFWISQEVHDTFKTVLGSSRRRIATDRCSSGIVVAVDKKNGQALPKPQYYAPLKNRLV